MLLCLSSRFIRHSPLLQASRYIPSGSANTFIDEEYIRENPPPPQD
jgi:hypothetical protein